LGLKGGKGTSLLEEKDLRGKRGGRGAGSLLFSSIYKGRENPLLNMGENGRYMTEKKRKKRLDSFSLGDAGASREEGGRNRLFASSQERGPFVAGKEEEEHACT